MLKKVTIAIVLLAAVLLILASVNVCYVHDQATGTLVWNSSEAYVFMDVVNRGYRLSYLKFVAEIPKDFLGYVRLPNDKHFSTVVVEVMPETGRRYIKQDLNLNSYSIFDGKIFSSDLQGGYVSLWFWSGTGFQLATAEEKKKIYDSKAFAPQDVTDVEGWSKRNLTCSNVNDFPIEVGGASLTVVRNCGYTGSIDSIELRRSGQSPQTIWNLTDRFHWVSKAQYQRLFDEH